VVFQANTMRCCSNHCLFHKLAVEETILPLVKRRGRKVKTSYILPRKPNGRRSTKRTKINSNRGIGGESLSDSPASVLETLGGGAHQKRSDREMEACDDNSNDGMMGFNDDKVDGVDGSTSSSCFTHTEGSGIDGEGGSGGDNIDIFREPR
jgi:hypothetical protein